MYTQRVAVIALAATEPQQYFVANSEREGCQLKGEMATVRFTVRIVDTIEGQRRERNENVLLLRTTEGWFLGGIERRVTS